MRLAFALFAAGALLSLVPVAAPTAWVEAWALHAFPAWAAVTSSLFAVVPFSLTLTLAGAATIALVVSLARPGRRWRRALAAVVGGIGVVAIGFVLSWGATYQRATVAATLGLPPEGVGLAALERAFARLVDEVTLHAPEAALAPLPPDRLRVLTREAARCVADLDAAVTGRRVAVPPGVRHLPPGSLLRAGYGGVSLPWLLEPHVDAGLPGAAFLTVATHELMHTAGWAREAETDALAVLAGLSCDVPALRYALALHGVAIVGGTIVGITGPGHAARADVQRALAELPAAAVADRLAVGEAVARYRVEVVVSTVGRAYDAYLRAHGVEAGVADYARAGAIVAAAIAACDEAAPRPWCAPATGAGGRGDGSRFEGGRVPGAAAPSLRRAEAAPGRGSAG